MPQPLSGTQASAWRCCWGCLALPVCPSVPQNGRAGSCRRYRREGGMLPAAGWAGPATAPTPAVPTCRGKGLLGDPPAPQRAILKRPSRRAQLVGLCLDIPMYIQLHGSASDPSLCHEPHSLSRPREAPAFLAKPGSSTRVRECGCDAVSTGHLPPAAPGSLQLGPAPLPEPAGTLEKRSGRRKGRSCWLSRGREVRLCKDTHLLHYPSPRQRD